MTEDLRAHLHKQLWTLNVPEQVCAHIQHHQLII